MTPRSEFPRRCLRVAAQVEGIRHKFIVSDANMPIVAHAVFVAQKHCRREFQVVFQPSAAVV